MLHLHRSATTVSPNRFRPPPIAPQPLDNRQATATAPQPPTTAVAAALDTAPQAPSPSRVARVEGGFQRPPQRADTARALGARTYVVDEIKHQRLHLQLLHLVLLLLTAGALLQLLLQALLKQSEGVMPSGPPLPHPTQHTRTLFLIGCPQAMACHSIQQPCATPADIPPRPAPTPGLTPEPPGLALDCPGLPWDIPGVTPDSPGLAPDTPGLTPDTPSVAPELPGLAPDTPWAAPDSGG